MMVTAKQESIIRQSHEVFARYGFQTTCVDRLLEDTGISKRTLYKYFRSKEALVAATVEYYNQLSLQQLNEEIQRRAGNPREQVLAIFDLKEKALRLGDFSGCLAMNAKMEYDGKHPEIEAVCLHFFTRLREMIIDLCEEGGYSEAGLLATKLMILLDGAIVYGRATRDPGIIATARKMADAMLAA